MIKGAILGYGVVGSGVYEIIRKNEKSISRKTGGKTITVKYILDLRDFPDHENPALFTKNYDDILNAKLRLILPADIYKYSEKYEVYEDMSEDMEYMKNIYDNIKIIWEKVKKDFT